MKRQDAKSPGKIDRNFLATWRLGVSIVFVLIFCAVASAAEVMPPAPENHFNDYAGVVLPATAQRLNSELENFERQTSNQILVAVYPKLQTDSSLEDYATRIFENWKVGRKGLNNGAALFVFVQDHKMRIVTGYGLEGALPDATCEQILSQEISPHFKTGDYDGGLTAGVEAMLAATRGEYKGNGRTAHDAVTTTGSAAGVILPILFVLLIIWLNRATTYGRYGRSSGWYWPLLFGMSSGGGSWGGGGSGGFGGGGGTFSGGGGMTGGGGASGSW